MLMHILVLKRSRDKVSNFTNSKRRPAAILKIVYVYISTIYRAINAKFGMRKHDHVQHRSLNQIPNFENSRWRTAAILKMVLLLRLGRGIEI